MRQEHREHGKAPDNRVRRACEARRKFRVLYLGATIVSVRLGEPGRGAISTRQFLILFLVLILVTLAAFLLLDFAALQ